MTDYFVDENLGTNAAPIGIVQIEGDHKIHVLNVTDDNLILDSHFNLDLSTAITHIPDYNGTAINGRPHGFAVIERVHHDHD